MTYRRTLPRDAFNEADLLKMVGKLWIAVHENHPGNTARFVEEDVARFEIEQDPSSGSISVVNLTFEVAGVRHLLERPLNSRDPWPLWARDAQDPDAEEIRVFDAEGRLSEEMLRRIGCQPGG